MHTILALQETNAELIEGLNFVFAKVAAVDAHVDDVSGSDLLGAPCTIIILVSVHMLAILTFATLVRLDTTVALAAFAF